MLYVAYFQAINNLDTLMKAKIYLRNGFMRQMEDSQITTILWMIILLCTHGMDNIFIPSINHMELLFGMDKH